VNRRAIIGSLGALLFSAGAAVGVSRLAVKKPAGTGEQRLVSLSPAITETVLVVGGAATLVAVSDYCALPPGKQLPRVGSSLTPNYEAIAGLRPSLILSDDSAGAKQRELAAIARCEVLPWLTLPDVVESTRRLGKLVGQSAAADALAQRLQARLGRPAAADAPRVLLLLGYDPDRPAELWFIKQNSLHGSALAAAGARNAVDHDVPGLPRLSVERLLALDPDQVLILPPPGATLEAKRKLVTAFSALAPLRAVKDNRVGVVNGSQSVGPSILELVDSLGSMLQRMTGPRPVGGIID
jgi:ABC-type Fe3+-hydroxamate transport system substrate-binding protein